MRDNQWELFTKSDGGVAVQYADGRIITVGTDGNDGYDFALSYLQRMQHHYRNHLYAADLLLRQQIGANEVKNMQKHLPRMYHAHLAVTSMNCIFGAMDNIPDSDMHGNLNVEFVQCPFRATCRYNGYNPRYKDKDIVCCNPIYDAGLTPRRRQIADLLVNTACSNMEIATALGVSIKTIENSTAEIYAQLGVENRQGLTLLLKNKRIV